MVRKNAAGVSFFAEKNEKTLQLGEAALLLGEISLLLLEKTILIG